MDLKIRVTKDGPQRICRLSKAEVKALERARDVCAALASVNYRIENHAFDHPENGEELRTTVECCVLHLKALIEDFSGTEKKNEPAASEEAD